MSKLWGGRFREPLADSAKQLSYTLHSDLRLVFCDIRVNRAHAQSLQRAGVLSKTEMKQLITCLDELYVEFEQDPVKLLGDDEDIHSCIERNVVERIGDLGKKMHTGKSRNDQVMTDTRLFVKESAEVIMQRVYQLMGVLVEFASGKQDVIFPGFTHFQPAQPVLFAHHMLAYVEMLGRDLTRFEDWHARMDVCPLGSGAIAGNNYAIDREWLAKQLGFSKVSQNSMDAVADRDFLIEFVANCSILMGHLSRFCEELVLWNSPLLGFITIGDAFTTGSSLMPQKKNPDIAELIRGKSSLVAGHLTTLQQLVKALPLTYNRDLQDDKPPVFETIDVVESCLICLVEMIPTISLVPNAIEAALKKGYLNATELADYLVAKQIPFREAHHITGEIVLEAVQQGVGIEDLTLEQFQSYHSDIDADVYEALSLAQAINQKASIGGTAKSQVTKQLARLKETYQWNNR